ncbi:MAG: hypothetical protein H0W47_07640 [Polaromonas sp.]|uniref:hypothetical protein n=1 Tax=Polaromonas sp. TaxID=1869339 RepID=UPI0017F9603F|nr:hypothetical protein [Polaromonas sp.]MBA3593660.1 hypothetical protein [Polaromonas sp.]
MTFAASSSKIPPCDGVHPVRTASLQHFFPLWQVLMVALVALVGFLAVAPDGFAEPLQSLASWLIVGGLATLTVLAVVTGLTRLLDCEGN